MIGDWNRKIREKFRYFKILHLVYLWCSLVTASLQTDLRISARKNLLLSEVPLVLGRHLGTDGGTVVFWMFLGGSAKGVQADYNLESEYFLIYKAMYTLKKKCTKTPY